MAYSLETSRHVGYASEPGLLRASNRYRKEEPRGPWLTSPGDYVMDGLGRRRTYAQDVEEGPYDGLDIEELVLPPKDPLAILVSPHVRQTMTSRHFQSLARTAQSLIEDEAALNRDINLLLMTLYGDDSRQTYWDNEAYRAERLLVASPSPPAGAVENDLVKSRRRHRGPEEKSLAEEAEIVEREQDLTKSMLGHLFIGHAPTTAQQKTAVDQTLEEIAHCREMIQDFLSDSTEYIRNVSAIRDALLFAHISKRAVWRRIRDRAEQAILDAEPSQDPEMVLKAGQALGYDEQAVPHTMYATGEGEVSRAGRRRKPARRDGEDAASDVSRKAGDERKEKRPRLG